MIHQQERRATAQRVGGVHAELHDVKRIRHTGDSQSHFFRHGLSHFQAKVFDAFSIVSSSHSEPAPHTVNPQERRTTAQRVGGVHAGFKLPWREAGPPDHLDDKVDSDL